MTPIRVVLIEDNPDFLDGLSQLIQGSPGYAVAGAFPAVEDALSSRLLNTSAANVADVILLDIHLPGKSGIEGIGLLKEKFIGAKIIMVTVFDDDENIFNAILAGADGYILKQTSSAGVLQSILDAKGGGTPMTPLVARRVLEFFRSYHGERQPVEPENELSRRELEVLQALVQGYDTKGIADALFISTETVRNHLKHIYGKLHVNSRAQAVAKAIKERLHIPPPAGREK